MTERIEFHGDRKDVPGGDKPLPIQRCSPLIIITLSSVYGSMKMHTSVVDPPDCNIRGHEAGEWQAFVLCWGVVDL